MEKTILGHIDCPSCGTPSGMRITHDRNGDPFGYCESTCRVQLRIGGDSYRVKKFIERHPWAAQIPVTVTVQALAPVKPEKKIPVTVTEAVTETVAVTLPAKTKPDAFADALAIFGVKK